MRPCVCRLHLTLFLNVECGYLIGSRTDQLIDNFNVTSSTLTSSA